MMMLIYVELENCLYLKLWITSTLLPTTGNYSQICSKWTIEWYKIGHPFNTIPKGG